MGRVKKQIGLSTMVGFASRVTHPDLTRLVVHVGFLGVIRGNSTKATPSEHPQVQALERACRRLNKHSHS